MIVQDYDPNTFPRDRWWYRLYLVIVGAVSFITGLIGIGFLAVGWTAAGSVTIL